MSVLELSRQALRRSRIRDSLPTDHPAVLDEIEELLDALPDPLDLGEELARDRLAGAGARDHDGVGHPAVEHVLHLHVDGPRRERR